MKKELFRVWRVFALLTYIIYVGLKFLASVAFGKEFLLLETCVISILPACLMPLGIIYGGLMLPRSKYLESSDINKPSYKIAESLAVSAPQGFDFGRLKTEINDKWVLSFSNDNEKVLKFRTKYRFNKPWPIAAWLKYDDDASKIELDFFPMNTMTPSKYDRKSFHEMKQWFEALSA